MALTYYEKQEAKVNIMHGLKERGWIIYGYKPDQSDPMTDYFSPAQWDGVAEKDGYILLVDIQPFRLSLSGKEYRGQVFPVFHHANPRRCNWHIEKGGEIIAQGNGAFKCYVPNDFDGKETKKRVDHFLARIEKVITEHEKNTNNSNNNNTQALTVSYNINHEKNGIEITFSNIPSETVRNKLKANGFRWSPKQKIWYAKYTDQRLHFAEGLVSIYRDQEKQEATKQIQDINNNSTDNNNSQVKLAEKIKVKQIKINWSESPDIKDGQTFSSFREADKAIQAAAMRHDGLGYWKTSYIVVYEDGQTYNGRIDITAKDNSLTKWMLNFVQTMAGLKKSVHWTNEEYQAYIKEHREDWLHFYNTYQIGDHVETETQ